MAIQYSIVHRTNAMSQLNTDIGTSCNIKLWTGSVPANCGAADTGTLLVTFTGNATSFGYATATLSSFVITGTAGQISFTLPGGVSNLTTGMGITITGTFGGTGSISGYTSGTTYFIVATNGTTTATISTTQGGSGVTTTAGTPTGLTVVADYGILTANTIANATAAGTGTAAYFRIYPSTATSSNAVVQGTCGTSGTDMILTNTSIASGQSCSITSITVTAYGA
jgi:hypothetical protein